MVFNKPNKRRIFLSSNRKDFFKIFSFIQEEDGDIYCHWPNFSETRFEIGTTKGLQQIHSYLF